MNQSSPFISPSTILVKGIPLNDLPADLFIPPDALEILLESFSGPLDLLLYLIKKQNLDIFDIPISLITEQYMQYIQLMELARFELASEYLVMASMLAEIKSRLLLPKPPLEDEIEEDPRMSLVRKLQLYEQYKKATNWIDEIPRLERDVFWFSITTEPLEFPKKEPEIMLDWLVKMMEDLAKQQTLVLRHQIKKEPLSVSERMEVILDKLRTQKFLSFESLIQEEEGRLGLIVSFLAILELARQSLILVVQATGFSPLYLKTVHDD